MSFVVLVLNCFLFMLYLYFLVFSFLALRLPCAPRFSFSYSCLHLHVCRDSCFILIVQCPVFGVFSPCLVMSDLLQLCFPPIAHPLVTFCVFSPLSFSACCGIVLVFLLIGPGWHFPGFNSLVFVSRCF